jgi:hypothetical protein
MTALISFINELDNPFIPITPLAAGKNRQMKLYTIFAVSTTKIL